MVASYAVLLAWQTEWIYTIVSAKLETFLFHHILNFTPVSILIIYILVA